MAREGLTRYFDEGCNKSGLPQSWLDLRVKMVEQGVLAMPAVFRWHCTEGSPMLGAQLNYLLTLQYFEGELDSVRNRKARKVLEYAFKKQTTRESKAAEQETERVMAQYRNKFSPVDATDVDVDAAPDHDFVAIENLCL